MVGVRPAGSRPDLELEPRLLGRVFGELLHERVEELLVGLEPLQVLVRLGLRHGRPRQLGLLPLLLLGRPLGLLLLDLGLEGRERGEAADVEDDGERGLLDDLPGN